MGGHRTIVIDTSPQAMNAGGFMGDEQLASRGIPVMGGGSNGAGRRHTTPRARAMSPKAPKAPMTFGGSAVPSNAKIFINKLV